MLAAVACVDFCRVVASQALTLCIDVGFASCEQLQPVELEEIEAGKEEVDVVPHSLSIPIADADPACPRCPACPPWSLLYAVNCPLFVVGKAGRPWG